MSLLDHTPTPWSTPGKCYPAHGYSIHATVDWGIGPAQVEIAVVHFRQNGVTTEQARANALFIMHAANCHDDLVKALEAAYVELNTGNALGKVEYALAKARTNPTIYISKAAQENKA